MHTPKTHLNHLVHPSQMKNHAQQAQHASEHRQQRKKKNQDFQRHHAEIDGRDHVFYLRANEKFRDASDPMVM